MKRTRLIVVSLAIIAALGLVWFGSSYAYTRVFWPRSIQQTLIGRQIAGYADLADFSDERGPFGEGFLRWRYKSFNQRMVDDSVCRRFVQRGCSFGISRKINDGVTITVEVRDGRQVTINEIWS
jgi:hypothetical protein